MPVLFLIKYFSGDQTYIKTSLKRENPSRGTYEQLENGKSRDDRNSAMSTHYKDGGFQMWEGGEGEEGEV
jgi:hypothetical protein